MALFYLDVDDGFEVTIADEPLELADKQAARDEAMAALPSVARLGRDRSVASIIVRDEAGAAIFRCTVLAVEEWLDAASVQGSALGRVATLSHPPLKRGAG